MNFREFEHEYLDDLTDEIDGEKLIGNFIKSKKKVSSFWVICKIINIFEVLGVHLYTIENKVRMYSNNFNSDFSEVHMCTMNKKHQ